jgi:hypothetical protein
MIVTESSIFNHQFMIAMILLIPYTRFTLKTYLSAYEAEQRLAAHVEPRKLRWRQPRDHKYFRGKIENGKFKLNIIRNIYYRNPLPITSGQIHEGIDTNHIEVTMRSSYFTMVLMALFDFALAFNFINVLFELLFEMGTNSSGINALTTSLGLLVIYHGGNMAFFNYEVNKARRHLERIFQVDTFSS